MPWAALRGPAVGQEGGAARGGEREPPAQEIHRRGKNRRSLGRRPRALIWLHGHDQASLRLRRSGGSVFSICLHTSRFLYNKCTRFTAFIGKDVRAAGHFSV